MEKLNLILTKTLPPDGASTWQRRMQAIKSLSHDREIQRINSVLGDHIEALTFHHAAAAANTSVTLALRDSSQKLVDELAASQQKPTFLVPFPRDSMFVGREEVFATFKQHWGTDTRRIALTGIGGVG